jgi:hypothetical protein
MSRFPLFNARSVCLRPAGGGARGDNDKRDHEGDEEQAGGSLPEGRQFTCLSS